jgi:hypothetical protein
MAKGFGAKQDEQLGYVLVLIPEANAYAAKFSLEFKDGRSGDADEKFIGITNVVEDAQVWKSQKLARLAIEQYYAGFILDQLEEKSDMRVNIKRLMRSPSGGLQAEMVDSVNFYSHQEKIGE